MPLELGLFLGAKRYGKPIQKDKRALIMDAKPYRFQRSISDLAGMDIHEHGGKPENAVRLVRNWLANASSRKLPSPEECILNYKEFRRDLPTICRANQFDISKIPYGDFQSIIIAWLRPR